MEYWEFLLQKEGDRSWLPLEGPIAGILEGRYRIIARSSYCETPILLRVSYQEQSDLGFIEGPQEHSRPGATNKEGLMVVLPFTSLTPGEWRFECSGDNAQSDADWHYELCLQVDPYEGEPWEGGDRGDLDRLENNLAAAMNGSGAAESTAMETVPPREEPASVEPVPEPAIAGAAEESTIKDPAVEKDRVEEKTVVEEPVAEESIVEKSIAKEPVAEGIAAKENETIPPEPVQPEVGEAVAPPVSTMPPLATEETNEAIAPPFNSVPAEETPLLATLPGDITIRLDRSTYITAWGADITLSGTLEPAQRELLGASIPATCQLSAILRDPATQQVLVNLQMPLLQVLDGDRPNQVIPLPCSFAFPVELPIETSTYLLLGELSAHSLANSSEPPLAQQAFTVAADIDVLARAVDPEFSAETCSNPDQIPGAPNTQLPTFATPGDQLRKNNLDLQFLSFVSAPDGSVSPIKAPDPEPQPATPQASESKESKAPASTAAPPTPSPETPNLGDSAPQQSPEPSFRPLASPQGKQGRFWSRLSSFAQPTQGNWLEEYQTEQAAPPKPEPTTPDAHLTEREILIDPDLDDQRSPASASLVSPPSTVPSGEQPFGGYRDPNQKLAPVPVPSIPTPIMTLPMDPVVCGTPVSVHLQVNEVPGRRIGLKFWYQDRQTRQLLEPPRWILDPTPNGRGRVESRVTVTVPPGLLEVQFEAIAIDLESQHTGQKASQSRQCSATNRSTQYYPLPGDGNQLFGSDI
ncbi:MAG: hypothetical protein AAF685_05360 [Cyanobacteria bacterium P01_C01_bin.89]